MKHFLVAIIFLSLSIPAFSENKDGKPFPFTEGQIRYNRDVKRMKNDVKYFGVDMKINHSTPNIYREIVKDDNELLVIDAMILDSELDELRIGRFDAEHPDHPLPVVKRTIELALDYHDKQEEECNKYRTDFIARVR
jgi:hypothetical protein